MSETWSLNSDAPVELLEERLKTIQLMIDMYASELNRWENIKNKVDSMIKAKLGTTDEVTCIISSHR